MVLSKKGSLRIFLMKINPSQNFSSRANFHINFYKFLIESIENSCFSIQNFKRFRVENVKCKLKFSVKFLKNFNRRGGGWGWLKIKKLQRHPTGKGEPLDAGVILKVSTEF